jgi:predicted porin
MNKNILAIAIAAAVAAPSAFAAATVYGVAHMSGNSFSSIGGMGNANAVAAGGTSTGMTSLSSNSSLVGIKGDEDLGGGMKAVYQMEFGVDMDGNSGSTGADASTGINSTRNTFVGVGGGFGTVLAGRHDSLIKMTGRKYDLFGDQIGNNRNILGGGSAAAATAKTGSFVVDGRHNNVLAYVSPSFGGVTIGAAYVPGDAVNGADAVDSATKHAALTAMVDYTAGYTFGSAKVVGLYQNSNTLKVAASQDKSQDTYGIGGSYKVGAAGTIKAQYYVAGNVAAAGAASNGGTLTTVGYDHAMSKNTTAYVVYAAAHNDAGASFTTDMQNGGSGANVSAVTGKDNSAFSVGLIHKF